MKILIIDGYNAIHKIPHLKALIIKSLKTARNKLTAFIADWKHKNGFRGKIIIFYDGNNEFADVPRSSYKGVTSIYSRQKNGADRDIINFLKSSPHPESLIVITDDNFIRNHCKVYGAKTKSPASLMANSTPHKNHPKWVNKEKTLSQSDKDDINSYLKKIWHLQ